MQLSDIIIDKIRSEGPLSFHDFMEMALYYPKLGYYINDQERIGPEGDYYTSPHFSFLFGEMLGKQIAEMWCALGCGKFTIVEFGAGHGRLCQDILSYIKSNEPGLYDVVDYCIVEKSCAMKSREQAIVPDKVRWCDSISEIAGFQGCVISNELLDNFSVHRVVMDRQLMEVYVDHRSNFIEVLKAATPGLNEYLSQLGVTLPDGYCTEINLEAIDWINDIAANMSKGFVITIDYGYTSTEFYNSRHRNGTLVCYSRHRINYDPYSCIGTQDITAHVNFSALSHWGALAGLECAGYTDQGSFLRALGITEHIRKMEQSGQALFSDMRNKLLLAHTLFTDMGGKFKVLVQRKGVGQSVLSGLRFSNNLV